jgi:predicted Zn finger-like uncharacterized protein
MALAARCPNCHALFRVAADQLKLRSGLVRCGACHHVFDAIGTLSYIDDASLSTSAPQPPVSVVIAAIRKAESAAVEAMETAVAEAPPPAPDEAPLAAQRADEAPTQLAAPSEAAVVTPSEATFVVPETSTPPVATAPTSADSEDDRESRPAGSDAGPEQPVDEAATTSEKPSAETASEPSFLREPSGSPKRRFAGLFRVGAVLLALLALAQLAVVYRAELLVRFPQARPALDHLCKVFRCTVNWPTRGDQLAVVGSELQQLPGSSAYELTAVVRNRGNVTLALPAIELTLSDTLNRIVARKVFAPADYLVGEDRAQAQLDAGLQAGADLTVRIAFEARDLNAAGFVVYPFYL